MAGDVDAIRDRRDRPGSFRWPARSIRNGRSQKGCPSGAMCDATLPRSTRNRQFRVDRQNLECLFIGYDFSTTLISTRPVLMREGNRGLG